jgi:hypothetical protein
MMNNLYAHTLTCAHTTPTHANAQVSNTYSSECVRAMLKQSLAHVLNPFKVKQVVRSLYAVTKGVSSILSDRSFFLPIGLFLGLF